MNSPCGSDAPGRRRWRDVDGIVLLDKPRDMSSNQALQRVRRLLAAKKGGHAGTLDPMATGMLPLCFGQATKACGQLLGSRKSYRAILQLGAATDTGDAEGSVVRVLPVPALNEQEVQEALGRFVGSMAQVPPMFSALKRDGRPLYEFAREGEDVPRAPRQIRIDSLAMKALGADALEFEVVCSKGTYVRTLAEDIAAALGTVGHLSALRRQWVEPFEDTAMVTLDVVEQWASEGTSEPAVQPWVLPVDQAFVGLPRVDLDTRRALHLRQGRVLPGSVEPPVAGMARAYGPDAAFLGLVVVDEAGSLRVARLFVSGANGSEGAQA